MLTLPETPRWLAGHGRMAEAGAVLRRLRGTGDIEAELGELRTDLLREGALPSWRELLSPAVRLPLIIGVGLAIFQQITGINTVIYFAPTIFQAAGLSSASAAISGDRRGRGRQCRHDPGRDPADRQRRPAHPALDRAARHGGLPASARPGLCHRRAPRGRWAGSRPSASPPMSASSPSASGRCSGC